MAHPTTRTHTYTYKRAHIRRSLIYHSYNPNNPNPNNDKANPQNLLVANANNDPNLVNAKGHRIFSGLALLGAAMADKKSKPTDKEEGDDVLNFDSSATSVKEGEESEEE